ncbi:hypothetical protein WME79_03855 [Sorangium sp. So ce726]|uniref:hypothetical protein n=1 Tax=Sorangium sp. So ce726 TaxID=3133319 RepID=UPI003F602530
MLNVLKPIARGTIAVALVTTVPACESSKEGAEGTGTIQAALTMGGERHDVTAIHYKVVDAGSTCSGAAIAETTSALEPEALPGTVLTVGAGTHAGADGLFVLPSGDYRVCVLPMSADAPSKECAPAEGTASVFSGATTEIVLVSQCGGDQNGGLDVVVALNDPPKFNDLDITPSKFITQCESAVITAAAEDPDGDQIVYSWSLVSSPAGAAPSLQAVDGVATFSTNAPGDYQVQITATDVHAASSSLTFPIHVSADNCGCTCPEGFTTLPDGNCAQSYDIGADLLVNQDQSCDDSGVNRHNGCSGPYGFQWNDVGAFGSVVQVDVELEAGIDCSGGSRTATLNGVPIGSFDSVGTCDCFSPHGLVSFPGVDVSSYVQGGTNSVSISSVSCDGLSQSEALGGAYARVTVTYSCGADACEGVTCAPQDQCHVAGSCDPATGLCSNPNAPDGTACDDGDPSTPTSVCVSGTCSNGVLTHPLFANGPGFSCPTGQTSFAYAGALDPTSSEQARAACEACYGVGACFLESADCAGLGWGPRPPGEYQCGEAYFGFENGCSGDDGRAWGICNSYDSYGYWGRF